MMETELWCMKTAAIIETLTSSTQNCQCEQPLAAQYRQEKVSI